MHLIKPINVFSPFQVALRMHPAGTLYLTLSYLSLAEAYDRTRYASPTNKLFGVDLETVIDRESSSIGVIGVPVIVRRCVDEIERRGLDIIGIYRLVNFIRFWEEDEAKFLRFYSSMGSS